MYLENYFCVCYNSHRQKEIKVREDNKKHRDGSLGAFLFRFWSRWLIP